MKMIPMKVAQILTSDEDGAATMTSYLIPIEFEIPEDWDNLDVSESVDRATLNRA